MATAGLVPALIGAGSNIIGSLFGRNSAKKAAQQQFEHQMALMEQQHNYQVSDYQHRHQWEVDDLKAAGLNPILSANSGASVAGVSAGSASMAQTPDFDISSAVQAFTNSAKTAKETKLLKYEAETDRIKAEADMLRARLEEQKTPSAIAVNESQNQLNLKNVEMLQKNYDLNKAYNEAQVREIDQRIINSVMEVAAKVQYYRDAGEAAKTSASAALLGAQAQNIIAQVAEQNGVSQRELNEVLEGKASAETKEAIQRMENLALEGDIKTKHNPIGAGWKDASPASVLMAVGEIVKNGLPF